MVELTTSLLSRIWRDEYRYQKGSIMLADFTPEASSRETCSPASNKGPAAMLLKVIDKIKQEGIGRVYFGARGCDASEWTMKRNKLSTRYTTSLTDIPIICT